MRSFEEIHAIAVGRHGADEVEARLLRPKPPEELAAIPDDRWLSTFSKAVFQAGFNWKVVENKWPGFEAAFDGFDVGRSAMIDDERIEALLKDTRIVRNGAKIASVRDNAILFQELARENGSAAATFAHWPEDDYAGLLEMLKKRGSRLGGAAQYALRFMGRDGWILSTDVIARLVAEGVIAKPPTSKKAMAAVQAAFSDWRAESGRSLTEISRVLALSI